MIGMPSAFALGIFSGILFLIRDLSQPAGCSKSHFHTRGRNKKQHLSASGQFSKKPQYFLKKGLLFAR